MVSEVVVVGKFKKLKRGMFVATATELVLGQGVSLCIWTCLLGVSCCSAS